MSVAFSKILFFIMDTKIIMEGVHLGTTDLPLDAARRRYPDLWIGASTHTLAEAKAAMHAGADYCGVGAMFRTATKERKPSGIAYLQRYLKQCSKTPHLAIGGINLQNIDQVAQAGALGVAVSSVVCADPRPERVVKRLLRAIPKSTQP